MIAQLYPRSCRLAECEAIRTGPESSWKDQFGLVVVRCTWRVDAAFCTAQHRRRHNDRARRRDEDLGRKIHTAAPDVDDQVLVARALSAPNPAAVGSRRRRISTTPGPLRLAARWLHQHQHRVEPRIHAAGSLRPRR